LHSLSILASYHKLRADSTLDVVKQIEQNFRLRSPSEVVASRRAFVDTLHSHDVTRFKFVYKTSTNLTYARRYGRASDGERARQEVPLHYGANMTLVAALTTQGLTAVLTVDGAVNTAVFAALLARLQSDLTGFQ
jgi:hypothetical protein